MNSFNLLGNCDLRFKILYVLLLSISCYHVSDCSEILAFFPFPGKSHHAVFSKVVTGLCQNGHNVTFVTPFPIESLSSNCTQIVIPDYIKELQRIGGMDEGYAAHLSSQNTYFNWMSVILRELGLGLTELTLTDPKVKDLVASNKKFDLILLETTFCQEAFIALHHRFRAPVIDVLPPSNFHWTYFLYGNPYDTSYIVDVFNPFTDHMTFQERLINTFSSIAVRASYLYIFMPKYQAVMDKHLRYPGWENRPPLVEMVKNTSLLLMNSHVALNYPYPLSPNVKEIGGIHLQPDRKPLPKDIQDFMDGASHGIIYFTLGSHIQVSSTLGDKLRKEFETAFSKLKQRVLWKWEKDYTNPPSNVKISKWFPQQDILAHKNMKLFITHGGILSMTEAVTNGLPLIGIPVLGDQPKNVRHICHFGYGVKLDFTNLTEKSISWAINEILTNSRYKQKAEEISKRFKDQPDSPIDTAVYWIEYVLRHNGAFHLRPAVTRLAWYQQAMLDVYLVLFIISLIPVAALFLIIKLCIMCFKAKWSSGSRSRSKMKKN